MNEELVEQVTKLVVQQLKAKEKGIGEKNAPQKNETVTFWSHTSKSKKEGPVVTSHSGDTKDMISLRNATDETDTSGEAVIEERDRSVVGLVNPANKEELMSLIEKTPARIGVGRAGLRPKTETWLKFRYDHAAAVDAVYGDVNDDLLQRLDLFKVNTKVKDKEVYIRRPDYGRKLSEEAKGMLKEKCKHSPTVQIIVSDGLSSKAVEENVEDVYLSLQQALKALQLDVGTPFYVEKGRVALMDDIGELLKPKVVVLLIGERPGLVSAESLSAYLCYEPRHGTIEADRMVISNIHKGGIPPVEAGAYLGTVIEKILKYEASGVNLVKKES
ncbi:ethanolamine ammonia-lyase subunit EutC [Sutcliffiella cohnii]|uniref:ethanolamine ammonia-lyase subunit EutC n=1 Tax=Sutcliffiella cohnii TaxID=33932 RepID=UPI002E1B39AF|nr:ethanolamine ammonia-lyase subunit EutC [Sutcliffiella cohnii]MED4017745.1 ethanolamine ammonia-lyase subunit EutC [Sutcliffiella cohnii]